jgi:hypothetical protein
MTCDFKGYTFYDLAFFTIYGSLDDSKIGEIGDVAAIRREIKDYVAKQPKTFQNEFQKELDSELERKARDEGTEGDD